MQRLKGSKRTANFSSSLFSFVLLVGRNGSTCSAFVTSHLLNPKIESLQRTTRREFVHPDPAFSKEAMVSMNVPLEDRAIIHKKGGIRAALSPTRKIRQQYYAEA